jgi:hypothetical protein
MNTANPIFTHLTGYSVILLYAGIVIALLYKSVGKSNEDIPLTKVIKIAIGIMATLVTLYATLAKI